MFRGHGEAIHMTPAAKIIRLIMDAHTPGARRGGVPRVGFSPRTPVPAPAVPRWARIKVQGPGLCTLATNGEGQASRLRLRKESGAAISPGGQSVAFHHCCPTGMSLPGCGSTPSLSLTSAGTASLTSLLSLTAPSGTQLLGGHLLCRADRARHRAAS